MVDQKQEARGVEEVMSFEEAKKTIAAGDQALRLRGISARYAAPLGTEVVLRVILDDPSVTLHAVALLTGFSRAQAAEEADRLARACRRQLRLLENDPELAALAEKLTREGRAPRAIPVTPDPLHLAKEEGAG